MKTLIFIFVSSFLFISCERLEATTLKTGDTYIFVMMLLFSFLIVLMAHITYKPKKEHLEAYKNRNKKLDSIYPLIIYFSPKAKEELLKVNSDNIHMDTIPCSYSRTKEFSVKTILQRYEVRISSDQQYPLVSKDPVKGLLFYQNNLQDRKNFAEKWFTTRKKQYSKTKLL